MATTVKMSAGPNMGSTINGNWGNYAVASDGTFFADTRDVPALLTAGCIYVNARTQYFIGAPPIVGATGKFVASASLANGALAIANQPDVMRAAQVVWGAGTVAISAGQVSVSYLANDGSTTIDTVSLALAASATATAFLTKGVVTLSTPTVSGLVGGASPFIEINSTNAISVPADYNTKDVTFLKEWDDGVVAALGTVSTVTLATITPTTTPNGTHTFAFLYTANTPDQ